MANLRFLQTQSFAISASGASAGDTTLTLVSFKQIDGVTNIVTADLGDLCYATLEPNNGTQEEAISFTGVTQNANGTATLTGVKTVGFNYPYTTTSGLAKSHAGGVTFILSNDAGFYGNIKSYIDTVALQGAPMATNLAPGITFLSVAAANAASAIAIGSNNTLSGTPTSSTNKVVDSLSLSTVAASGAVVQASASTGLIDSSYISLTKVKFGGTGADGALNLTTGATNIDLGGASVVIKNYTSISITGTGSLTFTNPATNGTFITLKSQGNVTLTSSAAPMIDASGMGAAGGASGASGSNGSSIYLATNKGTITTGGAGVGSTFGLIGKALTLFTGAGGAGNNASPTRAGGRGGGALLIECAGALNFTTAGGISVAGAVGAGDSTAGTFGAGGGAGGSCIILYNTLTSISGSTITIKGGDGGPCGSAAGGVGGNGTGGSGNGGNGIGSSGGGGGSWGNAANGSNGNSGNNDSGAGGASGLSLVTLNSEFA